MAFITFSAILYSVVLSLCVEQSFALAASEWFLQSRHGECVEVHSLKKKVQDLGDVQNPSGFIELMRGKGYQVTVNEVSMPMGKAVEVRVPERDLFLMFVTPEVCQQSRRE